jgi:hypothetical protein
MLQTKRHFEVKLKDDDYFRRFNNNCNVLDFDNPKFLICKNKDSIGETVLAMFPYDRIDEIYNEED